MNGQIAVNKWRAGGFHLVLMDIQLPIMSGLEATKEIRRLERINGIGVFSSSAPGTPMPDDHHQLGGTNGDGAAPGSLGENGSEGQELTRDKTKDRLEMAEGLFKSPVIIVALTASSLQSDRHEALAAGCNDFLTKVCKISVITTMRREIYADGYNTACQLCLARTESQGVGLHASSHRL